MNPPEHQEADPPHVITPDVGLRSLQDSAILGRGHRVSDKRQFTSAQERRVEIFPASLLNSKTLSAHPRAAPARREDASLNARVVPGPLGLMWLHPEHTKIAFVRGLGTSAC